MMDFLLCFVTIDETWVHYYEPENKTQSRQCVGTVFKPRRSKGQAIGHCIFGRQIYSVGFVIKWGGNN